MRRLARTLALALAAGPLVAAAQSSVAADSVLAMNRSGRWDDAARVAREHLGARDAPAFERCVLRGGLVWAEARLAHRDSALAELRVWDADCDAAKEPRLAAYAVQLEGVRRELAAAPLPALPATGVDFSAVEAFFAIADTLARDVAPSDAQWRALLATPGYRLASRDDLLRRALPVAFMPSRRAERDSVVRAGGEAAAAVQRFAAVAAARVDLRRFADSLARVDFTTPSIARAATLLPDGVTRGKPAPLVAFAVFGPDGYAQDGGVVVDVAFAREIGDGLSLLVAHEMHHEFLAGLQAIGAPSLRTPDGVIARTLFVLRNEGIADLVDKTYPLQPVAPSMARYAARYNALYDVARDSLRVADSVFLAVARGGGVPAAMQRLAAALPFGSHPVGAYMARRILETFGRDSLLPAVRNQFAFVRAYVAAERRAGLPVPFSDETLALFDRVEARYRK